MQLLINVLTLTILVTSLVSTAESQGMNERANYTEPCDPDGGKFCKTYLNTVACSTDKTCQCNIPEDTEFDPELEVPRCVGKVGSMCFAERSSISARGCVKNADCFTEQTGVGHSYGKCQCLYGYKETGDGHCERDEAISDDLTSTMRTTTTTKTPPVIPPYLTVDYGKLCATNILIGNIKCNTYERTVACINHTCQCNLREDAHFEEEWQLCVGKVGGMCFLEANALGRKVCTPNADCFPESEGSAVGTCQCLYGYKKTGDGHCERDEAISDDLTSTMRTTTTTKTPPVIPPYFTVDYGKVCVTNVLIGNIKCNTYERTVACIDHTCQCNLREDAHFEEEWQLCVGKVGGLCFLEANALGRKVCTPNADCFPESEGSVVGTCQCLYGYDVDGDRLCVDNADIPDKSTLRPTTARATLFPPKPSTTDGTAPTDGSPTTTPTAPGSNTALTVKSSCYNAVITFIVIMICKINFYN